MVGEPQVAMRVTSQIWQVVFASQTLPVFCFSFRKKAQYVVVNVKHHQPFHIVFNSIAHSTSYLLFFPPTKFVSSLINPSSQPLLHT
jgi:hypothetical protein